MYFVPGIRLDLKSITKITVNKDLSTFLAEIW